MIFNKLGLLGVCMAAFCAASPIEYIFTGTASGSVGSTDFTDAGFTFTFDTDTTDLVTGIPCCVSDISTPNPTSNTFTIDGISGSLTGTATSGPAVFLNNAEEDVGIWFFAEPDFLPGGNGVFGVNGDSGTTYNLATSIGPVALQAYSNTEIGDPAGMSSTAGTVSFTSVSDVTFQALLTTSSSTPGGPAATATPESGTLLMLGAGLLGVAGGLRRRRA